MTSSATPPELGAWRELLVGLDALGARLLDDDFPGDPADRLIYAAARQAGAQLVTRDARIAQFDPARVAW